MHESKHITNSQLFDSFQFIRLHSHIYKATYSRAQRLAQKARNRISLGSPIYFQLLKYSGNMISYFTSKSLNKISRSLILWNRVESSEHVILTKLILI